MQGEMKRGREWPRHCGWAWPAAGRWAFGRRASRYKIMSRAGACSRRVRACGSNEMAVISVRVSVWRLTNGEGEACIYNNYSFL